MMRIAWTLFGLVLVIVVGAAMMGVATVGEEEERVVANGAGTIGGKGHGARGTDTSGAGEEAAEVGDRGVGRRAHLEKGEASGIGGGNDRTFQDLPELNSRSHPSRLRQGTIFEMFEAEKGHRKKSGKGTSAPVMEEEELGSEDAEDADFDMEAEASRGKEDEEEQEAEAEEQPTQVRHGAKKRTIHEGVGVAGWSTLLEDGPLEGYRHRPATMRCFRTIHSGQVHTGSLK